MTLRIKPGSHRELIFQEVHSNPRSASGGQFAKDIVFKILSLSDGRKGEKRKMNFGDIFQKAFIEGFSNADLGLMEKLLIFGLAATFGAYLFMVYRFVTKQVFYSRQFNVSLAVLPVIVAAIIVAIQSSIVISLGMVGALSIVRFRTAVKDLMDLTFLFWAISVGIICGAGLGETAVIASLVITVMILVFDNVRVVKAPMLLVMNLEGLAKEDEILKTVEAFCKYYKVKSRNLTKGKVQ